MPIGMDLEETIEEKPLPTTSKLPKNQTILKHIVKTARTDGKVNVTETTVREDVYDNPANTSRSSTIKSVNTEHYTEEPDYGLIPKFHNCSRKNDESFASNTPCDYCGTYTNH